jgi:hypothetical protein
MLPHKHFLISAAAAAPFSLHHPGWILASGLVSAAVDMDVAALVWLKPGVDDGLRQFRNPLNIFSRYGLFMKTIAETGVLKTALKTHFVMSALILAVCLMFFKNLFVPVSIGVVTHILSDIPLLRSNLR